MTREEAIEKIRAILEECTEDENAVCYVTSYDADALDMAIKALEKESRKGHWIDYSDEGYVECPICRTATNCCGNISALHFCFSCGAEMESER